MRKAVKTEPINASGSLRFLYHTAFGRILLKPMTSVGVSKAVGAFMDSRLSRALIGGFVRRNGIDLSQYESVKYRSYNEFFTRRIKSSQRTVDMHKDSFISVCDSKLTVYKIDENSTFSIKNSVYTLSSFLQNSSLAEEYHGGWCFIFRLTVDDYHRYCYVDNAKKEDNIFIGGRLHTVQPISLDICDIYAENCREYTVLHTDNFDDVIQAEVGAMLIGRIKNFHQASTVTRGQEKGMFEFGGSTCVALVKNDIIVPDRELVENTQNGLETVVKYGEKIATKIVNN